MGFRQIKTEALLAHDVTRYGSGQLHFVLCMTNMVKVADHCGRYELSSLVVSIRHF